MKLKSLLLLLSLSIGASYSSYSADKFYEEKYFTEEQRLQKWKESKENDVKLNQHYNTVIAGIERQKNRELEKFPSYHALQSLIALEKRPEAEQKQVLQMYSQDPTMSLLDHKRNKEGLVKEYCKPYDFAIKKLETKKGMIATFLQELGNYFAAPIDKYEELYINSINCSTHKGLMMIFKKNKQDLSGFLKYLEIQKNGYQKLQSAARNVVFYYELDEKVKEKFERENQSNKELQYYINILSEQERYDPYSREISKITQNLNISTQQLKNINLLEVTIKLSPFLWDLQSVSEEDKPQEMETQQESSASNQSLQNNLKKSQKPETNNASKKRKRKRKPKNANNSNFIGTPQSQEKVSEIPNPSSLPTSNEDQHDENNVQEILSLNPVTTQEIQPETTETTELYPMDQKIATETSKIPNTNKNGPNNAWIRQYMTDTEDSSRTNQSQNPYRNIKRNNKTSNGTQNKSDKNSFENRLDTISGSRKLDMNYVITSLEQLEKAEWIHLRVQNKTISANAKDHPDVALTIHLHDGTKDIQDKNVIKHVSEFIDNVLDIYFRANFQS